MGQKDLYQSDFYEDKHRFADVFNGVFFEGKEVVKPEELEACDSVIVQHFEKLIFLTLKQKINSYLKC